MTKITKQTSLEDLAFLVCQALSEAGIEAVLVGGAVVSFYSNNESLSNDLDFITHGDAKSIAPVMKALGFTKKKNRHYSHPKTEFIVEFPAPPLAIGDEPIRKWATRKTEKGILYLLSPTECVMDRLAAFYHWRDLPSLDQAVSVASRHPINLRRIKTWSTKKGMADRYTAFLQALKKAKRS